MNRNKSVANGCIRLPLRAMKRTTELRGKPLLARDENTLHAKQRPPKLTRSGGCIALHPTSVSSPFLGPSLARSREVRPKRRACSQAMSRPVECRSLKRILKRAHWVRFPVLSLYWLLSILRPFRFLIPVASERIGHLNSLLCAGLMGCPFFSTNRWMVPNVVKGLRKVHCEKSYSFSYCGCHLMQQANCVA